MKVLALRVRQPLGEFFVSALPASTIVGRVNNRPRSSNVERSEDIQRIFSEKRVNEIADFSRDPQATFPTPIILALNSRVVFEVGLQSQNILENSTPHLTCFEIPDNGLIGDVLDGQHRVLGLERSSNRGDFDLPVVFMFDLSLDDKAFVFSIINSKQTPVSGSLIYDLFDLSKSPSPQKTCHYIAQSLNSTPGSPFFGRLKMLGRREDHHGEDRRVRLSQGSFAARLQELISKDPMEDARLFKIGEKPEDDARCPLRKYFIIGDDQSLLKITRNFFTAAAKTFKTEWEDEEGQFVIRKTVGYTALIIVLRHILDEAFRQKNLTEAFFEMQFEKLKQNLGAKPLTADEFPSSGAGAIKLAKALLGVEDLAYVVTEAPDIDDVHLDS